MAWELAWQAVTQFQEKPFKVEGVPLSWASANEIERRRAQRLFFGFLRWRDALQALLEPSLRRRPRPRLEALLLLATYELATAETDSRPAVVHHAVDLAKRRLSAGEGRLVNALLRRMADGGMELAALSAEAAHPSWLVSRWRRRFGEEATRALLAWNQEEPPVYACWEKPDGPPAGWRPSPWKGYYDVSEVPWPELRRALSAREAYVQDPFARHPVELVAPQAGETVLDGCAAPGGKSRGLLRAWSGSGRLVAADLPGARMQRLEANLGGLPGPVEVRILAADLRAMAPADLVAAGCPETFDAVLLDVPCSNTGVIARRPDVRYHLTPERLKDLGATQSAILDHVAAFTRPGGRLVYSTCSLEAEENEIVVEGFLAAHLDFRLVEKRFSEPWSERHDGGGAFLLTRQAGGK